MARRCWTCTKKSSFRGGAPSSLPLTAPPREEGWPCSTAWLGPRRCPARLGLPTSPGPGMPPPSAGPEENIAQGVGRRICAHPGGDPQEMAVFTLSLWAGGRV